MEGFQREVHTVNGVKIVMYVAGEGQPLLFLHGAGTFHGFEFARKWTRNFRVMLPYHPGFGESDDCPEMGDIHDYVMHYVDLLDALAIEKVNLVGFSLGGFLAARFASEHSHRVIKLALVGPAGLRDRENPMTDVLAVPPDQLPGLLVENFEVLKPYSSDRAGPRLHRRPVPGIHHGGAPDLGPSMGSETAAPTASGEDADAVALGRE